MKEMLGKFHMKTGMTGSIGEQRNNHYEIDKQWLQPLRV